MSLTVKVISYKGHPPVELLSASFDQQGGTLGRLAENHFFLPDSDKFISRKHAVISYEDGFYYLKDTSTAGTFIINKNQRVHHNSVQLADGDKLKIGDYDLIVSIFSNEDFEVSSSQATPWGPEPVHPRDNAYDSAIDGSFVPPEVVATPEQPSEIPDDLKLENFFKGSDEAEKPSVVFESTGVPTPTGERSQGIPDNFFKEPHRSDDIDTAREHRDVQVKSEKSAGQSTREYVVDIQKPIPPKPHEAYDELLRVFLEAAAIEDTSIFGREDILELMRTVGAVFRELIDGLMTILRGRTELKAQFRVSMTILRPDENNPLKFSPDVDEALKLLLTKKHRGFIDAVDAVREGYQDVMNHQLAITAGVQASLMNVLKRFDPEKFAKQFQEGIVLHKKAKCWDAYNQAYREIAKEALEDFFGDEFVRAYEEQMSKLRATLNKR